MKTIISLSGGAGSGKSFLGRKLAGKLGVPFLSIGNHTREIAVRMGMDIYQFQEYARQNPGVDERIDQDFQEHIRQCGACILDYRLGFYFFPDGLHVLLKVSDEEAVKRILARGDMSDGQSDDQFDALKRLRIRNNEMRDRLYKTYGADFTDRSNYHLEVDTTVASPEFNVRLILDALNTCG